MFQKIPLKFPWKPTAIFPVILIKKIPVQILENFPTHNSNSSNNSSSSVNSSSQCVVVVVAGDVVVVAAVVVAGTHAG